MKQLEVTIMGQSYVLACPPGGEDALQAAVGRVDHEMAAIRDAGKVKARERVAVLAALNLAYASPAGSGAANASAAGSERTAGPAEAAAPVAALADAGSASAEIESLIRRIEERLGDEVRPL